MIVCLLIRFHLENVSKEDQLARFVSFSNSIPYFQGKKLFNNIYE